MAANPPEQPLHQPGAYAVTGQGLHMAGWICGIKTGACGDDDLDLAPLAPQADSDVAREDTYLACDCRGFWSLTGGLSALGQPETPDALTTTTF